MRLRPAPCGRRRAKRLDALVDLDLGLARHLAPDGDADDGRDQPLDDDEARNRDDGDKEDAPAVGQDCVAVDVDDCESER